MWYSIVDFCSCFFNVWLIFLQIHAKESKIQKLQSEITELNHEIADKHHENTSLLQTVRSLQDKSNTFADEMANAEELIRKYESEIASLKEQRENLSAVVCIYSLFILYLFFMYVVYFLFKFNFSPTTYFWQIRLIILKVLNIVCNNYYF